MTKGISSITLLLSLLLVTGPLSAQEWKCKRRDPIAI